VRSCLHVLIAHSNVGPPQHAHTLHKAWRARILAREVEALREAGHQVSTPGESARGDEESGGRFRVQATTSPSPAAPVPHPTPSALRSLFPDAGPAGGPLNLPHAAHWWPSTCLHTGQSAAGSFAPGQHHPPSLSLLASS